MNRPSPHERRVSVTINWTDIPANRRAGTSALAQPAKQGKADERSSGRKDRNHREDKNLAAVTEVEAGIRDFVRKDVAYLRRTPQHHQQTHPDTSRKPQSAASTH
jgi:hypothetical protein